VSARDEFFVGYLPTPPTLGRALRRRAGAALALLAALGALLVANHGLRPAARFEYGTPVELAGTLVVRPYPHLIVSRPGHAGELPSVSSYTLVGPWKHGADALVEGFDGKAVRLSATLAYRDGTVLAELVPGSLRADTAAPLAAPDPVGLGPRTLRGEVVDSKCFFGVMNPGEAKPHRGCAVRCLSGGIPPVLCVRDAAGRASYLLLVSASGQAIGRELLDLVAEPVEVTGEVQRVGDNLVLFASRDSYRRLE